MKAILFIAITISSFAYAFTEVGIDCRGLTASKGTAQINGRTYYGVFTFHAPLNRPGEWGMCVGNDNDTPMYRYHSKKIEGRAVRYVSLFYCSAGFVRYDTNNASSIPCF